MGSDRLEFARRSIRWEHTAPNVYIHPTAHIGTGVVIGESGFGYERDEYGAPVKIYHAGGVIIGPNVWLGANCIVSRAVLPERNTIIKEHCKIDDLCHIAHNVVIGPRTMMASGCILGGSVQIGPDCWIGSGTTVRNKVRIIRNTLIGIGSVVLKDILEPGQVWAGNPARFLRMKREGE